MTARHPRSLPPSFFLVLFALLASPAFAAPIPDAADYAFTQAPGAAVPRDLLFDEADGRHIRLGDLFDGARPIVLALGYFHCPSLCGVARDDVMAALGRTGLRAGTDYALAAVSIDPAETAADAASALADDRERHPVPGDAAGLHFLTGAAGASAALQGAVGFHSRYDEHLRQFLHPAGLVVLTGEGRVSSYLLGVGYQPGDLRAALALAGTGGVAKAALPILLLCFHLDALTGRYSLDILKVLRLGAAVTVLGIAAIVLLLRRQDRRRGTPGRRPGAAA